ncbi:MAG: HipA domain-containing protein, partial [Gemmatimonadetes bacterium]|nr:HipA domain-containing protein [Gemmatimonadota bacterium]
LEHVGEDVAGAAQFVTPDRLTGLATGARSEVRWLTEADVAERLRRLREDRSAWRSGDDPGYFSLAGAQAKTALLLEGDRWGVPRGPVATSHILKPPMEGLDGVVENEHTCLELAKAVGLPAATSTVLRFEDEIAIVVTRYDRALVDGILTRIHQEDMCQALGIRPIDKYENQGGPGAEAIIRLLAEQSADAREDIGTFIRALAFQWAIGGPDAHGKNYSLLLASGSEVRLAPLYDVISALPYPEFFPARMKLAMRIGGEYRLGSLSRRHWQRLARSAELDPTEVLELVGDTCKRVSSRLSMVCEEVRGTGLEHDVIGRIETEVSTQLELRTRALVRPEARKTATG